MHSGVEGLQFKHLNYKVHRRSLTSRLASASTLFGPSFYKTWEFNRAIRKHHFRTSLCWALGSPDMKVKLGRGLSRQKYSSSVTTALCIRPGQRNVQLEVLLRAGVKFSIKLSWGWSGRVQHTAMYCNTPYCRFACQSVDMHCGLLRMLRAKEIQNNQGNTQWKSIHSLPIRTLRFLMLPLVL